MPTDVDTDKLLDLLRLSDGLEEAIIDLLAPQSYDTFDDTPRTIASFVASNVSLEHARGMRVLLAADLPTSAISLMRLQYEVLTRSIWLFYAAPDADIGKLQAPLSVTTEKAASRTPSLSVMLASIVGKAPPAATQMLNEFKDVSVGSLNSYVHGGIHPLNRLSEGYPVTLLLDVLRSSNGLLTMAGMMLALLSGNPEITKGMRGIQQEFADCLPTLLPHNSP